MVKNYQKPLALLGLICLIVGLDTIFGWSDYLGNQENLLFLMQIVEDNLPLAASVYVIITIVGCVVLALPGITFAVLAGVLFGPWLGTLLCLVATTAGAIMAFLAGRFFLCDSMKPVVMKNRWLKKVLFDDAGRRDVLVLMITRLVPLFPYNLQNFAYGITDISLTTYSVCTFFFMIPGVALFTVGAAGITAEENRWIYFAFATVLLAVVMLLGWGIRRKYLGELSREE